MSWSDRIAVAVAGHGNRFRLGGRIAPHKDGKGTVMRLVSFEKDGRAGFGAVVEDGIVDLGRVYEGRFQDLKSLLGSDTLPEIARGISGRRPDFALADVTLLPVIPNPSKIWCCGLNYHEHVVETQREVTEKPVFFLRVPDSQAAHGGALIIPRESEQLDFEGEIAVVIGRGGRRIPENAAAQHIAGYACYNDGSVRDWQRHTHQWAPGKNFAGTGGFGPWLVTADEVPFGTTMTLVTRLNGKEMQRATTEMLIHSIARQIAYVSTIAPLNAGDVLVTGTPGGIGARRQPPVWLRPGDVVEIDIDRIGVLRNHVVIE